MPFTKDYDDTEGVNHPNSYWVIQFQTSNNPNKTGEFVFTGYHDIPAFEAGLDRIGWHGYTINDPAVYDSSFGQGNYVPVFDFGFFTILEQTALLQDDFFTGASQSPFIRPSRVEIGSAGPSNLVVTFPAEVDFQLGGNFTTGVTIKINDVDATIVDVVKSPVTVLTYEIAETAEIGDNVTWEYDGVGFLCDATNIGLNAIGAILAENTLGTYWRFNDPNNSGQFAVHF